MCKSVQLMLNPGEKGNYLDGRVRKMQTVRRVKEKS
jgi:hypothetical protein